MRTLLIALLIAAAGPAHAVSDFTASLPPGQFDVGLRVIHQYDYSRVYKPAIDYVSGKPPQGERARPVQTLLWYPAKAGGKPVTYRDYMATTATAQEFGRPASSADGLIKAMGRTPATQSEVARTMQARSEAPARDGKFPVIVYAPSFTAHAAENVDLCEYLASQGYIVLSSPSFGARSSSMTDDLEGLEAQAGDIAFLIAFARSMPQADLERIGVVGFSWGGLANMLASAKDDRIKAVASLDGSLRGFPQFINGGKGSAHYFDAMKLSAPLLYVARRPDTFEEMNRREMDTTFSLVNSMKQADTYVVSMQPMQHSDFSSWAQRFAPDSYFEDYSREEVAQAYRWTVRYVHNFFNAYLKDDKAALTFMGNSPKANKAPLRMMQVDQHRAVGSPVSMDAFVRELNRRGFQHAIAIHDEFKARNPRFSVGEPGALNSWGYGLLRGGREKESVEIFRLATHLHPADANLFDSFGEACEKTGAREEAIRNYRRSLELNPKNANAVERLRILQQQS